jgi:glycosyltransferase involved in cell wall biosynthesis
MNLGLPIFGFDNVFNRHTTLNRAKYFSNATQLSFMINSHSDEELKEIGSEMYQIAQTRYKWKIIANQYADIIKDRLNNE